MRYLRGYAGLIFAIVLACLPGNVAADSETNPLGSDEAISNYHQGIAAQTIGEREQYFEKALELYLAKYNKLKQDGAINGLLCYNIANCYFNLEQNEEAIFYYQLGKKLLPTNKKIASNLAEALAKRSNAVDIESGGILESILFFHYKLGPAQQINSLVIVSILTAMSLAWMLIRPNIAVRYVSILGSLAAICLFLSLAVNYYMPTHMGILMKSSDIRRGAGSGFAPITARPFGAGSSIKVLSLADGWYSVKLNDGRQGFIQQENLKLVVI